MSVSQTKSYFEADVPRVALKSLFLKYDVDLNGKLDKNELYALLTDDLGLTREQSELYHHLLDKDADGSVSYEEFELWFHSGERFQTINDKTRFYYLQRAVNLFKKYDLDQNMAIDGTEFHKLYSELGGGDLEKENQAMRELDVDNNGRVSFQEFMTWLNWVPLDHLIVKKGFIIPTN